MAARVAAKVFKSLGQLFAGRGAAINQKPIAEALGLPGRERPVAERGNVRIDQSLLVGAPAAGVIWIRGVIEYRDAKRFASKRALDVAPGGALLFALASAQSI